MRKAFPSLWLAAILTLAGCNESSEEAVQLPRATLRLSISHVVGEEPLSLDGTRYLNAVGEPYAVEELKYYVSNVKLRNADQGAVWLEPESYHLVDGAGDFLIEIEGVEPGEYAQLEFALGVDNGANTSIDQVGDLDPSNQMAWNWNTGYKFLLLEGRYFDAETDVLLGGLVFHIGADPNYRVFRFSGDFTARGGETVEAALVADVAEIFANPNDVRFSENSDVQFVPYAEKVAENYASFFRLDSVRTFARKSAFTPMPKAGFSSKIRASECNFNE